MSEAVLLLLRLRGRQLRAQMVYWGRVLGVFGPEGELASGFQRVYRWYIALFLAGWVVLAWEALLSAAYEAPHLGLPAVLVPLLGHALPLLVLLGQVALAVLALLQSPLQMSAADRAYLAGSPVSRRAWLAVDFARGLLPWLAGSAPAGAALAVLLTGRYAAAWAGTPAALLLVVFAQALAWALGLARLTSARKTGRAALWLLPAAALACGFGLWPGVRRPGEALVRAMVAPPGAGGGAGAALGFLALLAAGALLLLLLVAGAVDARLAAEASAASVEFGDMRALRRLDPGLARRLKRRLALRSARALGRLPGAEGWWALPARVGVGFLRQPGRLLGLLATGAALLAAVGLVVRPEARGAWMAWLLMWLSRPPRSLVDWLEEAAQEPFLRRLVPWSALPLLAGDALLPGLVLAVLGGPVAALLGASAPAAGAVPGAAAAAGGGGLAGALVALLLYWALIALAALTQGVAVLGGEIGGTAARGSADLLFGLLAFGTVLLLGAQAASPLAALLAALAFDGLLAWSWGRPRRAPAEAEGEARAEAEE
ncbi:MAG: hypothetical protein QJR08_02710 [Bacillota bacterium]|nr:hypothetical protein [Bacillota bacterium]